MSARSLQGTHEANTLIEKQLDRLLAVVERRWDSDALFFTGPLYPGVDDAVRSAVESNSNKRPKLVVILETPGGLIEIAERMAALFRRGYRFVEFIVPNTAMSAGTVLVMCGDAIHMDYYSVLGPIDPQVARADGRGLVPALGYLEQYQRLIKKASAGQLNTAEMAFLVEKFDPAELYQYEQERDLSISLLTEWLVKYKFRNWKMTATRKRRVTDKMRKDRAKQIANALCKTQRWHSHSRGISMEVLVNDLKLQIEDIEKTPERASALKAYYGLVQNYMAKRGHEIVVHVRGEYLGFKAG